ncbi:MAG TPA: 4Fe-4S dicluster domain-containing protein [Dehalococcoidia bacterium]|nr:4Fe-4S dicluster domain-containing protein [Dehalococcoidia bacterium]
MKRVYVNEAVCIGCHLCEVYCQLQHAQSKDLVKLFKRENPRTLPRLRVEERGIVSFSVRCQQCDEAPCVQACLTGALARDSLSGTVAVDPERCIGCWTCLLFCPLGAIRQNEGQDKMIKCDLCPGEEVPVCVTNCPNEALAYVEV